MSERKLSSDQILALLSETPERITVATAALPDHRLQTAPEPGEWSANDVLAHLRACADVWGGCIHAIIAEDNPTLRAINPRAWIKQTHYLELPFRDSLHAFVDQRNDLLAAQAALKPADWERTADVVGAGKPLVRTVRSYAHRLAVHERPHVRQIERIAAHFS